MEHLLYESPEYNQGYLDALSDTLGMLGELEETPSLYNFKNKLREMIAKGE